MTTPTAGFTANYYDNKDFTDLKLTRVDPAVNFNWGSGSPDPLLEENTFSVRWTGQVQASFSETYTFTTTASDGVRLWVNNQLIIDEFENSSAEVAHQGNISLEAGQVYDIRLDYFDNGGLAAVKLRWESDSQTIQVVPPAPVDTTAPQLLSLLRKTPADEITDADTLVFQASFSEDIQGVDPSDFSVTGSSQATVQSVTKVNTGVYEVTVAGSNLDNFNGVVGLALETANDISDLSGNPLSQTASPTLETYLVNNSSGNEGPSIPGFNARYYDNKDFTNLKLARVDPAVNFNWGSGSPDPVLEENTFSVRWTGQIQASFSETYTFTTTASDGVRLWVNNQLIIDEFENSSAEATHQGNISLEAGQIYDIRLDYFENGGLAAVKLLWESNSQTSEVVPPAPVDTTAPALVSILRKTPADETTNADKLVFQASFSEDIQGIDPNDFTVTGNSQATIETITKSGTGIYEITVAGSNLATFNGVVGLTLENSTDITDLSGNQLNLGASSTVETYTLQNSSENNNNDSGSNTDTSNNVGKLTPLNEAKVLEINDLANAEVFSLTVELSKILTVGSLKIFSTDANGNNRNQIGAFSVVENTNNVLKDFTPTFNLLRRDFVNVTHLQFELEEKGVVSIGTPVALGDGTLSLTFDGGTKFFAALEDTAPSQTLVVNDAESIDLTGLNGSVTISGSIRREAKLDNVVDLYVTNDEGAVFDTVSKRFIKPGEAGYKEAAISNRLNINLSGTNGENKDFSTTLTGGQHLGIFIAVDNIDPLTAQEGKDIFFSYNGANGGLDRFKSLGNNTFGIEDQVGNTGPNIDFNDFVLSIDTIV